MTTKPSIHAAYVKAQAEMTSPAKGSDNPFFNSKYADLTSCWKACKAALAANDCAVMQGVFDGKLRTTLIHASGDMICDDGVPLGGYSSAKNPMQALGSAITYARRYGLCAMLGMAPEDDDGNSLGKDAPPDNNMARPITAEQVAELNALADEVGADKANFCKYLGVDSIADIHPLQFETAQKALESKRPKGES